jgi:hypothetical protein
MCGGGIIKLVPILGLSFVVYLRPSDVDELYGMKQASDYVRSVFEILTIIICCWFVAFEAGGYAKISFSCPS